MDSIYSRIWCWSTSWACRCLDLQDYKLCLSRLSLIQKAHHTLVKTCLWSCVLWPWVAWQLRPSLFSKRLSFWPFCWRLLRYGLDTAQYVAELVVISRPVLQAPGDIANGCLCMSTWFPEQHEVIVFESPRVWLLHTHKPKRKEYCL